jgi:hypothetical protein
MPIKDPTSRRDYFRNYMRKRRGGLTGAQVKPGVKPKSAPDKAAAERIAALEAEVARLKADPRPRWTRAADLDAVRAERTAALAAKRAEAKAAKLAAAAAERPDADVPTLLAENDALKQQLKAARTANKNLKGELHHFRQWHEQEMARSGGMSFATHRKIAKVLHPDTRKEASETDIEDAYRQFNAWKADKDKAQRQSKSKPA